MRECYPVKILALFPYNGRSHHIYFSTFVEELAARKHSVVVVNYFPLKNDSNLRQISLQEGGITRDTVEIEDSDGASGIFKEFSFAYDTAKAFKHIANDNCRRLVNNRHIKEMIDSEERFDVIIVEQFVTDCGFAIANRFKAPIVGMAAHVMFPWTYSRLGADDHPAFVPNHFTGAGPTPDLWERIKSTLINLFFNVYHRHFIQRSDNEIVREAFPDTPNLVTLVNNMSLLMLNQYFPLTGSRVYGANVVEIGGMHVKRQGIRDRNLQSFLDSAKNGVIYISFGSVASDLPKRKMEVILNVIKHSELRFIWKIENTDDFTIPSNVLTRKWLPQVDILCHENVLGFISHSGMLSSSEAMHCGVPVVSVPLFGDQFANAASARAVGLGVTIHLEDLEENTLDVALKTILRERHRWPSRRQGRLPLTVVLHGRQIAAPATVRPRIDVRK
ncbi:Ecdysteroid UDP-glucosyltransferase [Eumeta japonica]|uniref:UDP-glucuronosyltransferase n=1 Tax=Eumeta variegata TaxID=151549 RepID=A0A4C1WDL9_EUMVA|nr:Ecdysteroid UDP-glucosyltransferase [Eumeta japonica]